MKRITIALLAFSFTLTAQGQTTASGAQVWIGEGYLTAAGAFPAVSAAIKPHAVLQAAVSSAPPGTPVALKWTGSGSCSISGVTCYGTVYRSLANCASVAACAWTPLTTASAPAPVAGPYTDSTVPTTATVASYYVTNTATGNGWTNQESTASNIAVATFQQAPPAPPTGLTATN